DPFAGLRRGTAKAGALLRLLIPARETAAEAPPSAMRFFAEVLDQTGNGYLDWPDLAAMAREIATRLDLGVRNEDRLFAAFSDWWRELQAALDTDHDGRVSGPEYAATAATMSGPALIRVAEVLFDVTDTDDDQVIDAEEHRRLFRVAFDHDLGEAGAPARLTRAAFVREFLNFMAGRHHSDDYDRLFAQA
ncbi:calcium-binding protein, partial [Actinoallomurus acaciae]